MPVRLANQTLPRELAEMLLMVLSNLFSGHFRVIAVNAYEYLA
jgi:hypothetical protein